MKLLLISALVAALELDLKINGPWRDFRSSEKLEYGEYLYIKSTSLFWKYFEGDEHPDEDGVWKYVKQYRTLSPIIKGHYDKFSNLCPEQDEFIQVNGKSLCEIENFDVESFNGKHEHDLLDHVYKMNEGTPTVRLVSSKFKSKWFLLFKEQADQGKISLVHCWRVETTDDFIQLKGYGVQIEQKDTLGFEDENLGRKMAGYITSLEKALEVYENFPHVAKEIRRLEAEPVAEEIQKIFTPESDYLFINGLMARTDSLNVHSLVEFATELKRLEVFVDNERINVADLVLELKVPEYSIDEQLVFYLNDLEKDDVYSHWSDDLMSLLSRSPSGFYQVRKNLVTAVVVVDLKDELKPAIKQLATEIRKYISSLVPIRFGVLINGNPQVATAAIEKFMDGKGLDFLEEWTENDEIYEEFEEHLDHYYNSKKAVENLEIEGIHWVVNGRIFKHQPNYQKLIIEVYNSKVKEMQVSLFTGEQPPKPKVFQHRRQIFDTPAEVINLSKSQYDDLFEDHLYFRNRRAKSAECKYTLWMVVDPTEPKARSTLKELLRFLVGPKAPSFKLRLFFPKELHYSSDPEEVSFMEDRLNAFMKMLSNEQYPKERLDEVIDSFVSAEEHFLQKIRTEKNSAMRAKLRENNRKAANLIADNYKGPVLVVNSFVFGPLPVLKQRDFETLFELEDYRRTEKLSLLVGSPKEDQIIIMAAAGSMLTRWVSENGYSLFNINISKRPDLSYRKPYEILIHGEALEHANWLQFNVYLNPREKESFPISFNYYRFVANDFPIEFENVKSNSALILQTPPAWNVKLVSSSTELDNIIESTVSASFKVDLVIEVAGTWPHQLPIIYNGKEYHLTRSGYLQLPYSELFPKISVNSENKSNYVLRPDEFEASSLGSNFKIIQVSTRLNASPIVKSFKSDTINVFSIASGHEYERLLRIMMLSVVKNTKSKVKFWLLDNFVSEKFRQSIRIISETYKFQFEFVSYAWPSWLTPQNKKHRMVWAYKVLFLDSLFPHDCDRVMFIDADQVVRADISEVYNYDLGGKVWGLVPFCESRTENAGFQFWKSGYWKSFLNGKPYHISALFVIDLEALRQRGVADRLRVSYQMFSRDPSSLSNLDQDLINSMQSEFEIQPLPKEWLWCESWCDDKSKKSAKSIDLCRNPNPKYSKESKLDQAKRIIPDWSKLDYEVSHLLDKITKEDL